MKRAPASFVALVLVAAATLAAQQPPKSETTLGVIVTLAPGLTLSTFVTLYLVPLAYRALSRTN